MKILGIGAQLGNQIISNDDLKQWMDTSHDWIFQRTGIAERTFSLDQNTSGLATLAAQQALKDAQLSAEDLDAIIVCTFTPDSYTPSVASLVHKNLQIQKKDCMAFDINAACSGFVVGCEVVEGLLRHHTTILLIGAEVISKLLDLSDRSTSILFGDGAGALILTQSSHQSITYNFALPDTNHVLYANGVSLLQHEQNKQFLRMNGAEVYRFAIKVVIDAIQEMMSRNNLCLADIDLIIPHQANARIIQTIARQLNIDLDKFVMNIETIGNTSAASIPIALKMAQEQNRLKEGMKILLIGFGSGLTYGITYLEI